jgi:hypothetical protein
MLTRADSVAGWALLPPGKLDSDKPLTPTALNILIAQDGWKPEAVDRVSPLTQKVDEPCLMCALRVRDSRRREVAVPFL